METIFWQSRAAIPLIIFVWAFSAWYWARVLLRINYKLWPPPNHVVNGTCEISEKSFRWRWIRATIAWVPRFLGIAGFLLVIGALLALPSDLSDETDLGIHALLRTMGFLATVFAVLVIWRRKLLRVAADFAIDVSHSNILKVVILRCGLLRIASDFAKTILRREMPEHAADDKRANNIFDTTTPLVWKLLGFATVCSLALFMMSLFGPVDVIGYLFSPTSLLFLWAATWFPIGCIITYWSNRYRVPVVTILIVLAVLFSFVNDNHGIYPLSTTDVVDITIRPSMDEALGAWHKGDEEKPFVLVSTAGGGSRAGLPPISGPALKLEFGAG